MDTPALPDVNATRDFFKSLDLGPKKETVLRQSSSDRLSDFFYALKGAEGTLRNWHTRSQADRLTFVGALQKPVRESTENEDSFREKLTFWRTSLLGVLFMEALIPGGGDRLVAQAAFDSLFEGKVGKR